MKGVDIVTLLRAADGFDLVSETMNEGADEIERLRAALQAIYNHQKRMPNIDFTIWEITRAALREKE